MENPLFPDNYDEPVDLGDTVFAGVTATTSVSFDGDQAPPGKNEFYLLNSNEGATQQILVTGFNRESTSLVNAIPNVSTQGFGIDNQSINPAEVIQVDFVSGGTQSAGKLSQISYSKHTDGITTAGFTVNQITPSSPSTRTDITLTTRDVTTDEKGSEYNDKIPTPVASPLPNILTIKVVLNGTTYNFATDGTQGGIIVSGLGTSTVKIENLDNVAVVDFTTDRQFDRILIEGVDANDGLDITEFHFKAALPSAYKESVGDFIQFQDDGPQIVAGAAPLMITLDESGLTGGNVIAPDVGITSSTGNFVNGFHSELWCGRAVARHHHDVQPGHGRRKLRSG